MNKKLTDEQKAKARKIFTDLANKKHLILNKLDKKLTEIFKNYKKELEKISNKEDELGLEKLMKDM